MANRTLVDVSAEGLRSRAGRTLALMHRWGYAPSLPVLAAQLLQGPVDEATLRSAVSGHAGFTVRDGFVCLRGSESLIRRSKDRVDLNRSLAEQGWDLAREFASELVRTCPFVEAIALSGSLASGGYGPRDDIDFDLIVEPGSKYTCYLLAHLVGLRYGWRLRHRPLDELHHTPLLPKIMCINVVWTDDQIRPFERRDENMAFELFRCIPMVGVRRFEEALRMNPWVCEFFPQAYGRAWPEGAAGGRTLIGRVLAGVRENPRMRRFVERVCRRVSWQLSRGVQSSRRKNPAAAARMEFLRQAKYPYEVFQD